MQYNFDTLSYHFRDASLPPRYHRSYDISYQKEGLIKIQVYVYAELIAQKEWQMPDSSHFDSLIALSPTLEPATRKVNKRLMGGKTYQLLLKKEDETIYELIWDSAATITPETQAFIQQLKQPFQTDIDTLRATPYDEKS
ncbi:MAG: hypothetical protein EAZ55_05850 [Cytophagales bacterium]|nr:MAG: hypothetical protein EAZ55_05850 [Cytophagales bacterium]